VPTDPVTGDSKETATATTTTTPETNSPEETETHNIVEAARAKLPAQDAQRGVQNVEAVTLTWSKRSLVAVFILYAPFTPAWNSWQRAS
jgi:hypothetical protein